MRFASFQPLTLMAAVIVSSSCSNQPPAAAEPARDVAGACQPAFGGSVCTWARMAEGKVVAFGATIPMATIEQSPAEVPMAWPPVAEAIVALPAEVQAATGVDHLTIYWEAHGHPPTPYLTPHFDFHFYVISDSARRAMDCSDTSKPAALPGGYALPDVDIPGIGMLKGLCVPQMGMHALESAALADTATFSGAMVLGYYAGRSIFFEPMISKAMLLEKQPFSLALPTPAEAPVGVRFPTKFLADFDASLPGYRFVFSDFTM